MRHGLRGDRLNRLARLFAAANEDQLLQRLTESSTNKLLHHKPAASNASATQLDGLLSRLLFDDMRHLKEYWWEARLVSRIGGVLAVRPPVVSPYA